MRKYIFLAVLLILARSSHAQTEFSKRHGVRFMATLSPGYMFGLNEGVVSLSGSWNYYISEHISVHGEGGYFLSSLEDKSRVRTNHSLIGGLNYHFKANKRFDPFIGMQPGAGFFTPESGLFVQYKTEVVPIISFIGGMNYYVGSIFNFFVHLRYMQGQSLSYLPLRMPLSEIRIMAGLGFNFGVK
jgi:hypothetical protein